MNEPQPFRIILSASDFERIASRARESPFTLESISITETTWTIEVIYWFLDGTFEEEIIPFIKESNEIPGS
jgi:hypothetical protein